MVAERKLFALLAAAMMASATAASAQSARPDDCDAQCLTAMMQRQMATMREQIAEQHRDYRAQQKRWDYILRHTAPGGAKPTTGATCVTIGVVTDCN